MTIKVNGNEVRLHKKVACQTMGRTNVTLDEYLSACSDHKPVYKGVMVYYTVREPLGVITYLSMANFVVEKEA